MKIVRPIQSRLGDPSFPSDMRRCKCENRTAIWRKHDVGYQTKIALCEREVLFDNKHATIVMVSVFTLIISSIQVLDFLQ